MLKYEETMIRTLCINKRDLPKFVPNESFMETEVVLYMLLRCTELSAVQRKLLFKLNNYIIGKLGKNLYTK